MPLATGEQRAVQFQSLVRIHLKEPGRCPARGSESDNSVTCQDEMLLPNVCAWIEEGDNFRGVGINTSQVGPLEKIAALTSPSQVCRVVWAEVLLGNDVVEMKWPQGQMIFVEMTILTPRICALAHKLAVARRHQVPGCSAR